MQQPPGPRRFFRKPGRGPHRTGRRRLIPTWRATLLGLAGASLVGVGLFALGIALVKVPDAHAAATAQSNTWLYQDGTVLARTGQTNRQSIGLDKVSQDAQHATLAAEDREFYNEGAINPTGMLRAAYNTLTGKGAQGGSTITQQYVKNTYLTQQRTITRKVEELFISVKVDATMSKDDVLAGYLNTSYYGRGAYGIQAAAQAYFGIDADKLDPAQGAYLATLLNAPSAYDVSTTTPQGKQNAINRWNYVLDGMVRKHWLSAEDRAKIAFPQVKGPQNAPDLSGQGGYLITAAKDYLTSNNIVTEAQLARGGYTITLTIDPQREQQLQDAVKSQLTDNLDPNGRKKDANVQAGAASVDPRTGAVVALYGGADATKHWVDNATRRDYQAGSTFKALTLAAALNSNAKTQDGRTINADTVYDGTSRRPVRGGRGVPYAPPNEGNQSYGMITVQQATDWSVNSVFAQIAQDTGLSTVKNTAVALGLPANTPGLDAVPSISLGVSTPSVLDLAGAYATLDNNGQQITPWIVKSVEGGGEPVNLPQHKANQAITQDAARNTTAILEGVVNDPGGTGYRAAALYRPVAGKTGTTDDSKSVWFVGYTPELVTSVGLFGQDPNGNQVTLDGVGGLSSAAGGKFPAQIWTAYMKSALAGQPVQDFPAASGPVRGYGNSQPSPSASTPATPSAPAPSPSITAPSRTPSPTDTPTSKHPGRPSPTDTPTPTPTDIPTTPATPTLPGATPTNGQ